MAEESGTTETTGTETGSIGPEIVVDVSETQGIPSIDEKLLMGEDAEAEETEAETTSTKSEGDDSTDESSTEKETADSGSKEDEDTGVDETKAEADAEAKADTGKDETADTKSEKTETKKPPKGYVPLPAMQQAREKNRSLEGENSQLKAQLESLTATVNQLTQQGVKQPEQKDEGGFKRLSEEELADLTESSPDEAIKYLANLQAHQERDFQQRLEQAQQEAVVKAQREHATAEVSSAYERIEKAIPGLYDENSEAWNDLTSFASEVGITPEVFALASTPEALGLLPGQDEPQLVGARAADFVEALVGLQEQLASRGSRKETMRKELETEIRAEVEKELLTKFKNDGDSEHRSVTDIQGTKTEVEGEGFGDKVLTHAEFANLSDADKERYLAGS